ncbi:MAG TPA: sigma factor, partial [Actinomycetota bacterium]
MAERADPTAPAAFEDFYREEHAGLFGAMYLMAGSRQEAEELMQEAFLKVWERWDRIHTLENPTGYLYRTAMNVFRMRRRRVLVAARRALR